MSSIFSLNHDSWGPSHLCEHDCGSCSQCDTCAASCKSEHCDQTVRVSLEFAHSFMTFHWFDLSIDSHMRDFPLNYSFFDCIKNSIMMGKNQELHPILKQSLDKIANPFNFCLSSQIVGVDKVMVLVIESVEVGVLKQAFLSLIRLLTNEFFIVRLECAKNVFTSSSNCVLPIRNFFEGVVNLFYQIRIS